jgi:large subunit ribosomal protein L18
MALTNQEKRVRIKLRVRKTIKGTPEKPRMSVFRSNKQIYVQLIDDISQTTLVSACSKEKDVASQTTGINKKDQAALVGKLIAGKCKEKGIETVVFDRNGYRYHGRVKSLADAAREGGLKF